MMRIEFFFMEQVLLLFFVITWATRSCFCRLLLQIWLLLHLLNRFVFYSLF